MAIQRTAVRVGLTAVVGGFVLAVPAVGQEGGGRSSLGQPSARPAAEAAAASLTQLPVRYAEHRCFVRPVLETGDTLELYTDTGGGTSMLWRRTAERIGLEVGNVPDGLPDIATRNRHCRS